MWVAVIDNSVYKDISVLFFVSKTVSTTKDTYKKEESFLLVKSTVSSSCFALFRSNVLLREKWIITGGALFQGLQLASFVEQCTNEDTPHRYSRMARALQQDLVPK